MKIFNRFLRNTKGQFGATPVSGLLPAVMALAAVILILSILAGVVQSTRDQYTVNGSTYNVSHNGLTGMLNLSGQFGNIGTIIAIVTIIALLVGAFVVFQNREG